ncbi:MAG: hypothetical protein WC829_17630 [Hyphomicrobium sp.]|jgi:hypothetical protein
MWKQLRLELETALREIAHALSEGALLIGRSLLTLWDWVRPGVVLALNIVAALILLFEEWGWRPLSNLLAQLARYPLWAKAELFIAGLPPYGALVALAIPSAVLIPAKLLGVYFLASGHLISAGIVIVLAKIASTALIARVFLLTKPALMQIGWFARAYDVFMPWHDALFARIRASSVWRYGRVVKWRVRNYVRAAWIDLKPRIEETWDAMRPRLNRLGQQMRAGWRDVSLRISNMRSGRRDLPPPDIR